MRKTIRQLSLVLLFLIGACSDSSVFNEIEDADATETDTNGATADEASSSGTTANNTTQNDSVEEDEPTQYQGPDDFDFSLYLFHSNLQSTGGEIAFTEKYYAKPSGDGPIHTRVTRHLNTGRNIDNLGSENAVLQQYFLTVNSIKEIGVSYNGAQTIHRYNAVGEVYLDAIIASLGRRDTCTLQDHLDEFDLGTATGSANIASGVYEDVLHVFCRRVLESADGVEPTNYSWNAYYSRGVGLVFADGNWVLLDEDGNWFVVGSAYLVPEY